MPNWPCSRFLEHLKNNIFVRCSPHFGSLALVTIFQHPSTVSRCPRTPQNLCQTGQWKFFGILARCPRTPQNMSLTCGNFSVSWHGVPRTPHKQPCNKPSRRTFVPFWSIWCQTRPGVQEPFKTNNFVRCSSRVGALGAKLALVVILRHPSTVSQNLSKTCVSQGVHPIWCQNWPGW